MVIIVWQAPDKGGVRLAPVGVQRDGRDGRVLVTRVAASLVSVLGVCQGTILAQGGEGGHTNPGGDHIWHGAQGEKTERRSSNLCMLVAKRRIP